MCIRRHWICGRLGHLGRCCRVTRPDVSLVVERSHHVCTDAHTDGGVLLAKAAGSFCRADLMSLAEPPVAGVEGLV